MKRTFTILALFLIPILSGCGATEVGNPIGSVIFTGQISGVTSDIDTNKALQDNVPKLAISVTDEDGTKYGSDADSQGYFFVEVPTGHIYTFTIFKNGAALGNISFEKDDAGNRSHQLLVNDPDSSNINLGRITYQDGQFIPQHEPRRHMRGR